MIFRDKSVPEYKAVEDAVKEMIKKFSGIFDELNPKC
jgi:hypothetical protein